MRARGKVNLISLALIAAVAGGIYWAVVFAPVYLDNLDVKAAMTGCYAESNRVDDHAMRSRIQAKTADIGTHVEEDGLGNLTVKKGLGLKDEDITIERDEVLKTIMIRVEYTREVQYTPFQKTKLLRFVVVKEGPVPVP